MYYDPLTIRQEMLDEMAHLVDDPDDIRPDYSGRAMYGRNCLGYTGEDITLFAFRLAVALAQDEAQSEGDPGTPDIFEVEEALLRIGDPRSDSLGRSTIYYWPHISVEAAE